MAVRHAFTVDEWHCMGEAGLFGDCARVELLDGEVRQMSPIGSLHVFVVNRLTYLLVTRVGLRGVVSVQNPVVLNERSEPEPDVAVLAESRPDVLANPDETFLLVEVSHSSLDYDVGWKAPYYARTGIRECWVVDVVARTVTVMRDPSPDGYRRQQVLGPGDVLSIEALDGIAVAVEEVFGE